CILSFADALLVRFEQHGASFSLRRRSRPFHFADDRAHPGPFARVFFRSLSVAHHRGPDVSQFSMGHPFARNRISRALLRSLAMANKNRQHCPVLARRLFSPEAASL